jgi:hypothetical protein
VPEPTPPDLLREWRRMLDALTSSAVSVAGRTGDVPRQLVEPMQRQLELVGELLERERRLQADVVRRITAPVDAVFELLAQSATALRRQAEALESAGRALEESAAIMKAQAELFERTVATMRQPLDLVRRTGPGADDG